MSHEDATSILQQAIALLQRAELLLEELNAKLDCLESFQVLPEWVDKHDAAKIVCKHWKTLDRWRVDPNSTLLEGLHWQHDGGEVVYHAELLKDWYRHRGNPSAHQRTIDSFIASLPSNQPRRSKRKAS
jgi:hypothetical protein